MTLLLLTLLGCTKDEPVDSSDSGPDDTGAVEICDNGTDDDGDGAIDCDDSDCDADAACQTPAEDCTNGVDDDGDGKIDCEDTDCFAETVCQDEVCDNGVDDDGDGATDCDDTDCEGDPACVPDTETDCTDGVDEDEDGFTDCEDIDCTDVCAEDCENGVDDDADTLVDCDDDECAAFHECIDEICDSGVDDDGDGLIDCEDAECAGFEGCGEICDDGADNDDDGFTDCDDDDCWGLDDCVPRSISVSTVGSIHADLNLSQTIRYSSSPSGAYSSVSSGVFAMTASVTTITGRMTLTRKSSSPSCDWSVDTALYGNSGSGTYSAWLPAVYGLQAVARSGFQTSGACGGVGSGVLPSQFGWAGGGLYVATTTTSVGRPTGPLWMRGSLTATYTVISSSSNSGTTTSGGSYGSFFVHRDFDFDWASPTGGSSWAGP
jgi:hypothetical protein